MTIDYDIIISKQRCFVNYSKSNTIITADIMQ